MIAVTGERQNTAGRAVSQMDGRAGPESLEWVPWWFLWLLDIAAGLGAAFSFADPWLLAWWLGVLGLGVARLDKRDQIAAHDHRPCADFVFFNLPMPIHLKSAHFETLNSAAASLIE